jgi:hypothetical protein
MSKQYPSSLEPSIEHDSYQETDRSYIPEPIVEEKPAIVIPEAPKYTKGISNTIQIRSKVDATYKTIGAVSGRVYIFNGGGSIVDVNKEDADELLSRRKGRSCDGCSGISTPNSVFELV